MKASHTRNCQILACIMHRRLLWNAFNKDFISSHCILCESSQSFFHIYLKTSTEQPQQLISIFVIACTGLAPGCLLLLPVCLSHGSLIRTRHYIGYCTCPERIKHLNCIARRFLYSHVTLLILPGPTSCVRFDNNSIRNLSSTKRNVFLSEC